MTHLRDLGKFSLTESFRAHQNVGDLEFGEAPISIKITFLQQHSATLGKGRKEADCWSEQE